MDTSLLNYTDNKPFDEQVEQVRNMESITKIVGKIAHNLNNVITAISGYSEFLMFDAFLDDELRNYVEEIQRAVQRGTHLLQQLSVYSGSRISEYRTLDINEIVRDLHGEFEILAGESIDIVLHLEDDPYSLYIDPFQIERIIMNLFTNARDAISGSGTITFETKKITINGILQGDVGAIEPGEYVFLSVQDDGKGIDEETEKHMFEPFFTTRGKGKGKGLGLSTVSGIVELYGGALEVLTERDRGTRINVYLPRGE
jgi:signal transduction histidine kinase